MSPSSSQSAKKQKPLTSFFTPKATQTNPPRKESLATPPLSIPDDEDLGTEHPLAVHDASSSFPSLKRFASAAENGKEQPARPAKRARHAVEDEHPSPEHQQPLPVGQDDPPVMEPSPDRSSYHAAPAANSQERTSRYAFSQDVSMDDAPPAQDANEDDQVRLERERLHQKFVKKLGRPDSMIEIRRRNHFITNETEALDGEEDADDDEDADPAPKGRKASSSKKGPAKLTPMEKQVIDIKKSNPDTLLVIEVGYKYRFFGEDARLAAKELHIVCIPGKFRYDQHPSEAHLDRFASASFPTHRLHVHVKRLVQAGFKVGVVRQLETAALKAAGDNRNAPFVRKLTNLYTKGTYIDDTEGLDNSTAAPSTTALSSGHLLCLTETNANGWGTDEKVRIGFVAVQPTTGDVIYDDFDDGFMRSELETRLLHISPCEFVIVGDVSKTTEKVISSVASSRTGSKSEQARIERVEKPKTMAAQAYSHISSFYADKLKSKEGSEQEAALLDKVHQLSDLVTICLSVIINHLTAYGLEHVFDLTRYFQPFSARSHMLLNANTLTSLEIYQNQTDHTIAGSLFWTLNKTQTRLGQRLLRKWVGRPLLDQARLQERVEAVEELMSSDSNMATEKLRRLLKHIKGDLEKSLIRIYYKKCSRPELVTVLQSLQAIANEYITVESDADTGFRSALLAQAVRSLPCIHGDVVSFLERIKLDAAMKDNKYDFFRAEFETEAMSDHNMGIAGIEFDLDEHKKSVAQTLRKTKVEYATSSGIDYLIEVDNKQLKNVPASWAKISGTKAISRFHTPEIVKLIRERDQHKEALASACDAAFEALLAEIGSKYQSFRDCIQSLATLDCLLSLAEVSSLPGYCKPEFVSGESRVEIVGGRHPMVEQLLLDAYVPNDVELSSAETRALLVTGPNMGGKSSYVRSVALIAIMAQIGCFVPARSARLSLLDAVFTRMGAFDNMMKGESTFMVELNETSDILKQATPRSLVVLDELGRGTSTHDGVAIAQAVLDFMLRECKSLTLFITHYQALARMASQWPGGELKNVHMRFSESDGAEGEREVTFLYEVGEGTAHRSYGLNVARLAGLPRTVIDVAATKSKELEREELRRRLAYVCDLLPSALREDKADVADLVSCIEQLG